MNDRHAEVPRTFRTPMPIWPRAYPQTKRTAIVKLTTPLHLIPTSIRTAISLQPLHHFVLTRIPELDSPRGAIQFLTTRLTQIIIINPYPRKAHQTQLRYRVNSTCSPQGSQTPHSQKLFSSTRLALQSLSPSSISNTLRPSMSPRTFGPTRNSGARCSGTGLDLPILRKLCSRLCLCII